MMEDVEFTLKANNFSQSLKMALTKDGEAYSFTLWGKYNDNDKFQADFDDISRDELKELRAAIDIILEA